MATTRQRIVIVAVVAAAALIGALLPAALTNTAREKQARAGAASVPAARGGLGAGPQPAAPP